MIISYNTYHYQNHNLAILERQYQTFKEKPDRYQTFKEIPSIPHALHFQYLLTLIIVEK